LLKAALNIANDRERARRMENPVAASDLARMADRSAAAVDGQLYKSEAEQDDHDRKRKQAIAIARSLLPRIGESNVQRVMAYILDAVSAGEVDVPTSEIADALGLRSGTIRVLRMRGFERLAREARSAGVTDHEFALTELALDDDAHDEDEF
jgi:hypothetical protein